MLPLHPIVGSLSQGASMKTSRPKGRRVKWLNFALFASTSAIWLVALSPPGVSSTPQVDPTLTLLAYNELGMHCMNHSFKNMCILPPYNTIRAQLIVRGGSPQLVEQNAQITYSIPGNTVSNTKTNFWSYAQQLFGVALAPNIGLTGHGLSGTMVNNTTTDYIVTGVPITPIQDNGALQPYNLATITANYNGHQAMTQTVVPVSWEISCNLCHGVSTSNKDGNLPLTPEDKVEFNILRAHDKIHGTHLMNQRPVLCASCHADPALGTPGVPGVKNMSSAMHMSHATRIDKLNIANKCYACHPGVKTLCQRDIHVQKGVVCTNCHGSMQNVGDPIRKPWVDEPKCSSCHHVAGHEYEEPGKLYKESRGHGNILCANCHNSPHAITPTLNPEDNVQAIMHQGYPGVINKCTVCHTRTPTDPFPHRRGD